MSTDDLSPDRGPNGYLAAKLARLERLLEEQAHMLAEQAARLRVVEQQLNVEPPAQGAHPFGQGRTVERGAEARTPREPVTPAPPSVPPSVTVEPDERPAPFESVTTEREATSPPAAPAPPDWRTPADAQRAEHDAQAAHAQAAHAAARSARPPTPPAPAHAHSTAKSWDKFEALAFGRWVPIVGIVL
ncbi:MAG TPA: hypothetical protein VE775_06905, partial [Pyrinomonadaceae bacterium]|nr:hypothetical protein [Pyrinomonadaceae bacterium]